MRTITAIKSNLLIPKDGLSCWLKNNVGLTFGVGDAISEWYDSSGSGVNFSQNDVNKQPTLQTNIQNGLPALLFDGSNDCMSAGDKLDLGSGSMTIFIVEKGISSVTVNRIILGKSASATSFNSGEWRMTWNDTATAKIDSVFYTSTSPVGSILASAFETIITTKTHDSNFSRIGSIQTTSQFLNGVAKGTQTKTVVVADLNNTANLVLGGNSAQNGAFFNGYIMEVIIYNRNLTVLETSRVRDYLRTKFNHY